MRALLSTIGTRGDAQPLVALAMALRALGQDIHMCVPPDFRDWIEGLGFSVTPIGPELRSTANPSARRPTPEQVAGRARSIAAAMRGDGAERAARQLIAERG